MDELKRLAYLQAMGIDAYVSRRQVAAAAPTRRIALVRKSAPVPAQPHARPSPGPGPDKRPNAGPAIAMPSFDTPTPRPGAAAPAPVPVAQAVRREAAARFSLAAVMAGGWLWLDELGEAGEAPAQQQLLQAMAAAIEIVAGYGASETRERRRPELTQFDWPINASQHFDHGPEAARSAVVGFVRRKLEQQACEGLVLLGRAAEARLILEQLDCAAVVRTVSSVEMLRDPRLKKQAWLDLRPTLPRS